MIVGESLEGLVLNDWANENGIVRRRPRFNEFRVALSNPTDSSDCSCANKRSSRTICSRELYGKRGDNKNGVRETHLD